MTVACKHAGQNRSLVDHYDVACGDCGQIIGRVALTPSAVLDPAEARWLLDRLKDDGDSRPPIVVAKLRCAAERNGTPRDFGALPDSGRSVAREGQTP